MEQNAIQGELPGWQGLPLPGDVVVQGKELPPLTGESWENQEETREALLSRQNTPSKRIEKTRSFLPETNTARQFLICRAHLAVIGGNTHPDLCSLAWCAHKSECPAQLLSTFLHRS